MYPEHNQTNPENPNCEECSAYPANPDSEYRWEKFFSERLYLAYARNYKIPTPSLEITIYMAQRDHGMADARKRPRQYVVRLRSCQVLEAKLKFEGTVNKLDHSNTSVIVLKQLDD